MELNYFILSLWKFLSDSMIDLIALCWFLFCWIGYSAIVDNYIKSTHSLSSRMYLYRLQWMTMVLKRENRVVDINILNAISQSNSFFASTSILIIAGFLALLSSTDTALDIIRDLPFATQPTITIWYLKIGLMITLFVYAFFKYTWALRQINYSAILIGAMPMAEGDMEEFIPTARRAAMVTTMAAIHTNRGLRTYYFSMAALSWFINPWLFILGSALVVWVIYRREFLSDIVHVLNMPGADPTLQHSHHS